MFRAAETLCDVATSVRRRKLVTMPLEGEYAPSPWDWSREQADKIAKNSRVELQDGSVTHDYDAREVFGDEKAVWWERAVEAYPEYADYQTKTDRQIPVFVLTPVH